MRIYSTNINLVISMILAKVSTAINSNLNVEPPLCQTVILGCNLFHEVLRYPSNITTGLDVGPCLVSQ